MSGMGPRGFETPLSTVPDLPATRYRGAVGYPAAIWFHGALLAAIVLAAALAPVLAPMDPASQELQRRLAPPGWVAGTYHPLGTDHLGRDVLSRILWGARPSLAIGVAAVVVAGGLGTLLGLVSGVVGSWVDQALMTVADVQLAFPFILLAIALIAVLGPSLVTLVAVLGLSGWVVFARIVRGQVLSLKEQEFVEGARALGAGTFRTMAVHILPNTISPVLVIATLELARVIVLEASLSFLGLGIQPPTPSWGGMLRDGREHLATAWWVATFPGIALLATCLAVNRIGDALRDLLDPRLRHSI
jgi:peptide/nickel transport system permease protein